MLIARHLNASLIWRGSREFTGEVWRAHLKTDFINPDAYGFCGYATSKDFSPDFPIFPVGIAQSRCSEYSEIIPNTLIATEKDRIYCMN
jgi:hypothetical protein